MASSITEGRRDDARQLLPWVDRYPFVAPCAARVFRVIELVSDKVKKTEPPGKVTDRILMERVRRGLITMSNSAHFRIQPPLTTDEATAMNGLAILEEVFDLVGSEGWWC